MEPQQTICPPPLLSFAGDSWKFQFSEGKEKGRRSGIPPPEAAPACSGWLVSLSFPLTQQPNVKCVLYFHSWTLFLLPSSCWAPLSAFISPIPILNCPCTFSIQDGTYSLTNRNIHLPPTTFCCSLHRDCVVHVCLPVSICPFLSACLNCFCEYECELSCLVVVAKFITAGSVSNFTSFLFACPNISGACRLSIVKLSAVCALQDRKEKKGKRERGKTNVVVLLTMFPSFPIFSLSFSFFFLYQETE